MQKKWIAAGAAVLLTVGIGWYLNANRYVTVDGVRYARHGAVLDVRGDGLSPQQYVRLQAALPEREVLWELPFQGKTFPLDTRELKISYLSETDVALLDWLQELETVDALDCWDLEELLLLQERRPECDVRYKVRLGNRLIESNTEEVTLTNADGAELETKLRALPELKTVYLEGTMPENLDALKAAYPEIQFLGDVEYAGMHWDWTTEALDFSQVGISEAAVADALLMQLPNVQFVDMRNCEISQEDMKQLVQKHPDVQFLWEMDVFGQTISTDAEEIDISGIPMESTAQAEELLKYFYNVKKIIMCDCELDNETMDALNRKYENVKFVWNVQVGWRKLRTDIDWFMPWKLALIATTEDMYNLRYCTDVVWVDIGHMNVENCEWAAFMPNLKYLLMGDTPITDITPLAGLKNLVFLEIFKTKVTDYSPLLTCTGLEDLNLGYTYGDPEPISQMTWLKNLWWHRPTPPWGGPESELRLHLADYLPNATVNVRYTNSSTDEGWRELPNYFAMRDYLKLSHMEG